MTTALTTGLPRQIPGVDDEHMELLHEAVRTWHEKRKTNLKLSAYYDAEQPFRNLGISIPPNMKGIRAALGWPQRAVQALARKHRFEGFSVAGQQDPFEISGLLDQNHFEMELAQAINSAYKHSCAFLTVSAGDTSIGEPEVVVLARDAEDTGAVWDRRRRMIKAAVVVSDRDEHGFATDMVFFLPYVTYQVTKDAGRWQGVPHAHRSPRPMIEPLAYDPQTNRPMGRSRITKEVRYLTDAAIRTMVRAETTAEFFAAPQRYVMGAAPDAFKDKTEWSAIMGRVLALTPNTEGLNPTAGQFPAHSPQPHVELYRQLAQNFCAATDLPQDQVGIFADNPTSAEAKQAAEAALSEDASYQNRNVFTSALRRTAQNMLLLRDNEGPRDEVMSAEVNWTPPRYVSPSAASNWAVQAVTADPTLQGSTVVLRRLGLTEGEISEVRSEQRRRAGGSRIDRMLSGEDGEPDEPEVREESDDADETDDG